MSDSNRRKRIQAVLDAAVAWMHQPALETTNKLVSAVAAYETDPRPALAAVPVDPMAFTCPHCGAERPSYGWHYNLGDTGPFALQWLTCFCGECKNILGVCTVAFMPKQELADQLKKQFASKVNLA